MRTYLFRFPIYVITHRHTDAPPKKKHRHTGAGRYPLPHRDFIITWIPGSGPGMTHTKKFRNTNPNNRIFIIGGLIGQSRNTKGTQWIPACAGMTTKNNKVPLWRTRKRYCTKRTHRSRRRGPGFPLGCRGGTQCQGVVIPPCLN